MKLIPLTKGKFAIVDDEDYDAMSRFKWHFSEAGGYARRNSREKNILMHRQILEVPDGKHTDHRNGDGLDNRRSNLRICNRSENLRNRKLNCNNTSGAKGVRFIGTRGWEARIQVEKRPYLIGLYETKAEAVVAYDVASRFLHGEFGRPNQWIENYTASIK